MTEPAAPEVDPLSSPDAMRKALAAGPAPPFEERDWDANMQQQKDEAQKLYEQSLAKWKVKNNFNGKKVTWTLRFSEVIRVADDQ